MITKALLLFLATMGSAGVLYRSQLQSLIVQALRPPAASSRSVVQPPAEADPPTNSSRLVAGQFHPTTLDEPRSRTNRWENTVSTAGGPVVYPVYRTEVVKQVVPVHEAPRSIVRQPVQRQPVNPPPRTVLHNGN